MTTISERASLMAAAANRRDIARAVADAARAGADDDECERVMREAQATASARFPERQRRVQIILGAADLQARVELAAGLI